MTRILSTYPASSKTWFMGGRGKETTVGTVVEGLERQYGLWQALLDDLEYFHREVVRHYGGQVSDDAPVRKLSQDVQEALNEKKCRIGKVRSRYTYLQHLQSRLNFLTYIMANSTPRLTTSQVELIWTVYVEQSLTNRAADIAFDWFSKLSSQTEGDWAISISSTPQASASSAVLEGPQPALEPGLLGDQLLSMLFQRKLQEGPVNQMRPRAAQLFLQLFLYVNGRSRAIRRETDSAKEAWARHAQELEGLETLWNMALEADDMEVSRTMTIMTPVRKCCCFNIVLSDFISLHLHRWQRRRCN